MNFTKAEMLQYLKQNMADINILPIYIVYSDEYFNDSQYELDKIISFSREKRIIVRSSSTMEDAEDYSNAGKFESVSNVEPDKKQIDAAIRKVYNSYNTDTNQQILIQPMLEDIKKSGVVFTSDIDTGAEYYIVNFYEGNDAAAVTSGNSIELKTFIKYKKNDIKCEDVDMKELIKVCGCVEAFLHNEALDIEFAILHNGEVFILQVRPLAQGKKDIFADVDISCTLKRIFKKVCKLSMPHPFLLGQTTCFGVMPDWNPAEILGIRPKKLAISLYKELITDNIWAHQRYDYGYRNLTMHPLMVSFCGIPYIDTRITFNSFIPQKLNEGIAEKLVNYYLVKLANYPKYHDKIEFEIVYSCYYLGIHDDLKMLLKHGFNENEIARIEFSLLDLTNNIINPVTGLYKKDIKKVDILLKNYDKIMHSGISLVDKIYWLIEECKEYGTLPFAGVARAAFIAVQFLKSFVKIGIMQNEEYDLYMNSLDTVNKKMNRDLSSYYSGNTSKDEFIEIYGHIRPGTYDILSKRYDEGFDEYFSEGKGRNAPEKDEEYCFSEKQMKKIQLELEQNGILISALELLDFIKEAIEGREYLKFAFTKCVSEILKLIEELGERAEISREDMAFLDISIIKQLYSDLYAGDIKNIFVENINSNKRQFENAIRIKLPSIIVKPEDIYAFYLLSEEPNFITQKSVTASTVQIGESDYTGKIVFVQAADPGYDYLFSKNIAGLVTQFGGANSHMAIRCAELGIPAIIGAGESNYAQWSKYQVATIDCQKKQVVKIE